MTGARVLSARKLSALCALLIAAAISVAFSCASLAQSGSGSENSSRPRRAEEMPKATPTPPKKDEEITLDGDSGSIWFQEESGHVVALNFSGEDGIGPLAEYALAHRVSRVLELLNVRVP